MNFVRLSDDSNFWCWSRRFDCNTASFHQAMRSIVARWYAALGAFRSSLLFRLLDGVPSYVLINRLFCCLIVDIQASGMSIPLSLLMLVGWSLIWMASLTLRTCVPVGVTINKLNLAPTRNMPRFVSVLRNRRGLSTSKSYVSVMFFYPFSHWSPCFTDIHFAAFAWDLVNYTALFWWFQGVLRSY